MNEAALRLAVFGAGGRMGQAVCRVASGAGVDVAAAVVRAGSPLCGQPLAAVGGLRYTSELDPEIGLDAIVDFSTTAGFDRALAAARARRIAFVSGSTGLSGAQWGALEAAAAEIPVLWAANFSLGVALLEKLVALAAATLGADFDAEVIEAHHGRKIDAPSGTALVLGEAIASARGVSLSELARYGRHGSAGPRRLNEIGFVSIRAGDIVGEHTVLFAGSGERLELTHRATDRAIFARGAVHAAAWLAGRGPGRYALGDTLERQGSRRVG